MGISKRLPRSNDGPATPWLTRWSSLVALISGAAMLGLAWGQHRARTLHPHYLPVIVLLTAMAGGGAVALASGCWRIARGPSRRSALGWTILALIPMAFWGYVGVHAFVCWRDFFVPNDIPMNLAKVLGAALMRLEASIECPNRLETERVVMFYKQLDEPRRDVEAMERHLARLEAMIGGRLRGRVFWVRGQLPVLRLGRLSVHGIALGSDRSPEDWEDEGSLDRHELAHAALDQFRTPGSDPPYVLHEGWAKSQSGPSAAALADEALEFVGRASTLRLRDLFSPSWYYRDQGPVYPIGGALVDFIIRKYGIGKFLRFYNECGPESADAVCRQIFGKDIDGLEAEFWDDARRRIAI